MSRRQMPLLRSDSIVTSETIASQIPSEKKRARKATNTLTAAIVADHDPTAWAPYAPSVRDFQFTWRGDEPDAVRGTLLDDSVEWTRPVEELVLPRARARIEIAGGADSAFASYAGALYPFSRNAKGIWVVDLAVALLVDPSEPVTVEYIKANKKFLGALSLERREHSVSPKQRVHLDPTCSRFIRRATAHGGTGSDWLSIGCRRVIYRASTQVRQSVELHAFWDNARNVRVDGVAIENAQSASRELVLRLNPEAKRLELRAEPDMVVTLEYAAPSRAHGAMIELGIGPNVHHWLGVLDNPIAGTLRDPFYVLSPLAVMNLSYEISDTLRLISFNAVNLNRRWDADLGFYVNYEAMRVLDRRFTVNLLIGAHAVSFMTADGYVLKFGAPQGTEVIFRDAFVRNFDLSLGGFLYPEISNKSYYNVYLRYGTPNLFGEINVIEWSEPLKSGVIASTKSLGLTVGFPLVRFF
jgi:hypothetical protein